MAEKIINGNILLYGALGLGLGLIVMNNRYEEEKHYWRKIHAHRRHQVAVGLRELHHGIYDLRNHNKEDGINLIESGAETIQRAEFGFPRHDLYHPHPKHQHIQYIGNIMYPHHSPGGPSHVSHPIHHIIHSHHHTPTHKAFSGMSFDNSQRIITMS
jgi:hypothetical protein